MRSEFLECCGKVLSTGNSTYINIVKYKSRKFFKKYTSNKIEIKKEIVLVARCQNCQHKIIKFLWYSGARDRFDQYVETKIFKGKKADKISSEYIKYWSYAKLTEPILNNNYGKTSKKIPWVYGKSLNDGISQVPRYIDETENAGCKILSPIKIID